jgi:hypothetical protein
MARASGTDGSTVRLLSRVRSPAGLLELIWKKRTSITSPWQWTDALFQEAALVRAANNQAAAERAEMKVALRMRNAISVTAVNVREV